MRINTFAALFTSLLLPSPLHAYTKLSDASLAALPSPGDDFNIHTGALLAPILKVRIPGTPEIEEVRQHFVDFFRGTLPSWDIHFHNATLPTALGKDLPFVNLVMTRDPPWAKPGEVGRLTLVAHYDSKLTPKGFIGATDSAAPCAMLMHAARSLDNALTKKWEHMQAQGHPELEMGGDQGIQIIFLDGEEAFIEWTHQDSLYGARYVVFFSYAFLTVIALSQRLGTKRCTQPCQPIVATSHPSLSLSCSIFLDPRILRCPHTFRLLTGLISTWATLKPAFAHCTSLNLRQIMVRRIHNQEDPLENDCSWWMLKSPLPRIFTAVA
jgi:Peptidase family M28